MQLILNPNDFNKFTGEQHIRQEKKVGMPTLCGICEVSFGKG